MPDATGMARKVEAAKVLAAGGKIKDAAEAIGVHPQTILKWKRSDEDFQRLLGQHTEDAASAVNAGLSLLYPKALDVIDKALTGRVKVSATQIRAALDVIKAVGAAAPKQEATHNSLEKRLAELDRAGDTDSD